MPRLRIVLDTDVVVAAVVSSRGASRALMLAGIRGDYDLIASASLFIEYEAVLTRLSVLEMAGVSAADVGALLDQLADAVTPAYMSYSWRPLAKDPDDDLVIEAAANGLADAIATFNVADMVDGAARMGIRVVRPGVLLREISL